MKVTFEFKSEEEYETFRDMLGLGMIEMVNRHDIDEPGGYFKAQNVFEVYTRVFKEMVRE